MAFSLMKVLVVLLSVAVLVAIALPVIGGARGAARSAACFASLRGLHTLVDGYRATFKGSMPMALYSADLRLGRVEPFAALASIGGLTLDAGTQRQSPWFCRADARPEADFPGVSYAYLSLDLAGLLVGEPLAQSAARLGKMVGEAPNEPLFCDDLPRHGPSASGGGQHFVRLDGGVTVGLRR